MWFLVAFTTAYAKEKAMYVPEMFMSQKRRLKTRVLQGHEMDDNFLIWKVNVTLPLALKGNNNTM